MNLTSNFDYCVELGIDTVKQIFHLAFKAEDRYPHNVGPFTRTYAGRTFEIEVRVLDDETNPADLSFADDKHILFSFPFEIVVRAPDAPDPSLSQFTIRTKVGVPALLTSWAEDGTDVLGLSFSDLDAAEVTVDTLDGLPTIDAARFAAAIHSRYDEIQHVHEFASFNGTNVLVLYDDARDIGLSPANMATPYDITVEVITSGPDQYLKVTAPIHVTVPIPGFGSYLSYGRIIFHRKVVPTDTDVTVDMTVAPGGSLATVVELDTNHPAKPQVLTALTPMVDPALANFGIIREPAFGENAAKDLIRAEVQAYLVTRRFPVYSPQSLEDDVVLSTPVGFLLPSAGVLAILLTKRGDGDPFAPDDFLGGGQFAAAVGRARVDELIAEAIADEFPDLGSEDGQYIEVEEGNANLFTLTVTPSNAGEHGESVGHLWTEGTAEVHIDCWPDPDVSFSGPIYVDAHGEDVDGECTFEVEPHAGEFDIGQSCCDVFLDLIIPIVGWIVLGIVEATIDEVGGQLITEIAESQERVVAPFPSVINGIAEVQACLTGMQITSDGFIVPGDITVRRLGRSFEDLEGDHDLPPP